MRSRRVSPSSAVTSERQTVSVQGTPIMLENVGDRRPRPQGDDALSLTSALPSSPGGRSAGREPPLPSASTASTPQRHDPESGRPVTLTIKYLHPDASEPEPIRPKEIGKHRAAFSIGDLVDSARHDCFHCASWRCTRTLQGHLRPRHLVQLLQQPAAKDNTGRPLGCVR